jgi:hypothetical protein
MITNTLTIQIINCIQITNLHQPSLPTLHTSIEPCCRTCIEKEAGEAFRTWDTAVKLAWAVPRSTHTYLVAHLLSFGLPSTKKRLLCQYVTFFKKLRQSTFKEVRVLSDIVARDAKSPTGHNLKQMEREFKTSPLTMSSHTLKILYNENEVPEIDL